LIVKSGTNSILLRIKVGWCNNQSSNFHIIRCDIDWVYFGIREQVLQNRYEESIEIVDTYLQDKYPNETWRFDTHVEEGRKIRPTKVKVIFDNEQSVNYIYKVYERNWVIVYEVGFPKGYTNFKHDVTHN
jgi:hypothetical protein